jgi:transcriptional regulator with XRE-family HTH domain
MKSKVQVLREEKALTQSALAERAGISLRTVQRIESGTPPKGFTLAALAEALDVSTEALVKVDNTPYARAALINTSTLLGLLLPFGNLILPGILTYKTNDPQAKNLGKALLSVQIIYTLVLSGLLIVAPFLQHALATRFPLLITVFLGMKTLNAAMLLKNGQALRRQEPPPFLLKYSLF